MMLSRCASRRGFMMLQWRHSAAALKPRQQRMWNHGSGLLPPVSKDTKSESVTILPPLQNEPLTASPEPTLGTQEIIAMNEEKSQSQEQPEKGFNGKMLTKRLHRWYSRWHPGRLGRSSNYEVSELKDETGVTWYTASFVCPVTGYVMEAGTLRDDFFNLDLGKIKVIDGKNFYDTGYMARRAAAGRMMDCLRYSQVQQVRPRRCMDEPLMLPDQLFSSLQANTPRKGKFDSPKGKLSNDYQNFGVQRVLNSSLQLKEDEENGWTATFTCPVTGHVEEAGILRDPRGDYHVVDGVVYYDSEKDAEEAATGRFLDQLTYARTAKSEPRWCNEVPVECKDMLELLNTTSKRTGSHLVTINTLYQRAGVQGWVKGLSPLKTEDGWTCSFTCPITGHIVQAGTLRDSEEYTISNGAVYYISASDAKRAAAARFLDDLQLTETGETEPRLCEELPGLIEKDGVERLFQKAEVDRVNEDFSDTEDEPLSEVESDVEGSQGPAVQPVDEEEEDEEELIIQNVPAFGPATGVSTLERVMDALGEPAVTLEKPSQASHSPVAPMKISPAQQKNKAINDTLAWCRRLKQRETSEDKGYRVFNTTTLPVTLQSAAAALRTLAKAHWRYPSNDTDTDQRVEAAAKQMLDFVWTIGSPSVDAYNFYLRCLCRSNALEAAQIAEGMMRAMIERKEVDNRLLPIPNIVTFNVVIQLWATVGGPKGFGKCEEMFDLILESNGEEELSVEPNRDTFLSVLSALARPSSVEGVSHFNRERAQHWIDLMRQFGQLNEGQTLEPDTQVFNAPLRWCGGNESARSRPFAPALAWDSHDDLFKNSFRALNEEDPLFAEARRMEEWLHEMEATGPVPDIETFEAAIQAWVRTGMADGLRRAELVALRCLASDKVHPRLQTFHPVFAAWAYSGDERGSEKVQEWIERLEKSASSPDLTVQSRFRLTKFLANRTHQERLLADPVTGADGEVVDHALSSAAEIAESCSKDLDEICNEFRQKHDADPLQSHDFFFVDPAVFSHALCAWGDVAKEKQRQSDGDTPDLTSEEIQSILTTVRKFDDLVQHLRPKQRVQRGSSEEDGKVASEDPPHFDFRLQQFLQYSPTVYLNALSYLNELDQQESEGPTETSLFCRHFYDAESMLRRSEELRKLHHFMQTAAEDDTLVYDDLYEYQSDISDAGAGKSYLENQVALYSEIVDGCKRTKGTPYFGDAIRLCMLILDFVDSTPEAANTADCTELYLGIISVVDNIPNEHERYHVLRRVFRSVNAISEESPFSIDKDSIMSVLQAEENVSRSPLGATRVERRRQPPRARRIVKRQRWRSASSSRS